MTTLNVISGGTYSLDTLLSVGDRACCSIGVTERETVDGYAMHCYGPDGDQPGDVPLSVLTVDVDGSVVYVAAETPDECTIYHSAHDSFVEAERACGALAKTL